MVPQGNALDRIRALSAAWASSQCSSNVLIEDKPLEIVCGNVPLTARSVLCLANICTWRREIELVSLVARRPPRECLMGLLVE